MEEMVVVEDEDDEDEEDDEVDGEEGERCRCILARCG